MRVRAVWLLGCVLVAAAASAQTDPGNGGRITTISFDFKLTVTPAP